MASAPSRKEATGWWVSECWSPSKGDTVASRLHTVARARSSPGSYHTSSGRIQSMIFDDIIGQHHHSSDTSEASLFLAFSMFYYLPTVLKHDGTWAI